MPLQTIGIGAAEGDNAGDKARLSFTKANANFTFLDTKIEDSVATLNARINEVEAEIGAIPIGGRNPAIIVPSDTFILTGLVGGIYLPNGGKLAMEFDNGVILAPTFPPESYFPNCPKRVRATGSDSGIVAYGYFV